MGKSSAEKVKLLMNAMALAVAYNHKNRQKKTPPQWIRLHGQRLILSVCTARRQ
jgi:hypothetical protein